ncbi:hypothetical protein ACFQL0_16875 [Haloplanus litoreus]|uniref:hypothetical protein n=1 Tax=Haloplanus litoreus TaxID=767515 RepID=UPI003622AFB4
MVTTPMARLFEMDYLGRFDISMHEAETIHTPEESRPIPDGYWEDRSERRSDHARLLDLLPKTRPRSDTPTTGVRGTN